MQDNLVPYNSSEAAVQQNGDKSVAVFAQPGSNIYISNTPAAQPQAPAQPSAKQMMDIASFSTDYYQLITTVQEDVFETNVAHIRADRALCKGYVPDVIFNSCSSLSPDGIKELLRFPAIICQENTDYDGKTDPNQMALYARITHILPQQFGGVDVLFEPLGTFPQCKMCEPRAAAFFGIDIGRGITTLNHSAWRVIQRDLFEAFRQAGIEGMPGQETRCV